MIFPQVSHSDFAKAIMWLVNFSYSDTYVLPQCKLSPCSSIPTRI